MDLEQLELDLRPKEDKEGKVSAQVLDLQKARFIRRQNEQKDLYQAIISSVNHISVPSKQYK